MSTRMNWNNRCETEKWYRNLKVRTTCVGTFQDVFFWTKKGWNIPNFIFGISKSLLPLAGAVTGPSGTGQIKTGAPCRSERLAKYNQLWLVGLWWFRARMWLAKLTWWQVSQHFCFSKNVSSYLMFRKGVIEAKNLSQSLESQSLLVTDLHILRQLILLESYVANQPRMIHCWALWQATCSYLFKSVGESFIGFFRMNKEMLATKSHQIWWDAIWWHPKNGLGWRVDVFFWSTDGGRFKVSPTFIGS